VRTRRFTPGFVARDGGSLLPVDVGLEVDWPPEASPEVEGAGGGGAGTSSPAISAIARVSGGLPAAGVLRQKQRCGPEARTVAGFLSDRWVSL
jgi:hypothetical protein